MMKFTQKVTDQLFAAWKEGKTITIKGVNYYGTEFTTEGIITTDDSNEAGIIADRGIVVVDVGYQEKDQERSAFFAPFRTEMAEIDNSLVILSIEVNGKVIFKNPKRLSILSATKKARQQLEKRIDQNETGFDDTVVAIALENMVGKPVLLDDLQGVFIALDYPTKQGLPSAFVKMGPYTGLGKVTHNSVLSTETKDGKIVEVANNANMDIFSC